MFGSLRPSALALLELLDRAGGLAVASYARLARRLGLARVTVRGAVAELEAAGLLEVEHRRGVDGAWRASCYRLTGPAHPCDIRSPHTPLVAPQRGAPTACAHARCADSPACQRRGPRDDGRNPRATGANPRARGCSPRQLRRRQRHRPPSRRRDPAAEARTPLGELLGRLEQLLDGPRRDQLRHDGHGRGRLFAVAVPLLGRGWTPRRLARVALADRRLPDDTASAPALIASRLRELEPRRSPAELAAAADAELGRRAAAAAELERRFAAADAAGEELDQALEQLPDAVRAEIYAEAERRTPRIGLGGFPRKLLRANVRQVVAERVGSRRIAG